MFVLRSAYVTLVSQNAVKSHARQAPTCPTEHRSATAAVVLELKLKVDSRTASALVPDAGALAIAKKIGVTARARAQREGASHASCSHALGANITMEDPRSVAYTPV